MLETWVRSDYFRTLETTLIWRFQLKRKFKILAKNILKCTFIGGADPLFHKKALNKYLLINMPF